MLFETGTQHVRVEGDHLFQIGDPEHDMVDILDRQHVSAQEPFPRELLSFHSTPETAPLGRPQTEIFPDNRQDGVCYLCPAPTGRPLTDRQDTTHKHRSQFPNPKPSSSLKKQN